MKPTIGIIGAGRLGSAIAKQALSAGYTVHIANSKEPESLQLILSVLLPGAHAGSVEQVIVSSDLVILAIPLGKYKSLKPELFTRKVVIDAMNYWPSTEGHIPEFANPNSTSSEFIQTYLPTATVIKTLNHVAYSEIQEHSLPVNDPNRRAVIMTGDNAEAKQLVATFIDDLGFDAVDNGTLAKGRYSQPGMELFATRYTKKDFAL